MENRELVIGGFYKHFKDKLYQVKGIAYHSETKEKMVVYQALYGDYSCYVRPFDMFLSEVDHNKYPDVTQRYRFEQVFLDGSQMPQNKVATVGKSPVVEEVAIEDIVLEELPIEVEPIVPEDVQTQAIHPGLEKFLDADSYQEKLDVLRFLRDSVDDRMIDTMAASIDVEVPEGDINSRYQSLVNCVRMQTKYECNR